MLVLARAKNEVIIINDDIKITILDIGHDQVRLGIDAPQEIRIYRQELYDRIQAAEQTKEVDLNVISDE